eukprot:93200-Pleurochrysis_carterae.AAC.2
MKNRDIRLGAEIGVEPAQRLLQLARTADKTLLRSEIVSQCVKRRGDGAVHAKGGEGLVWGRAVLGEGASHTCGADMCIWGDLGELWLGL